MLNQITVMGISHGVKNHKGNIIITISYVLKSKYLALILVESYKDSRPNQLIVLTARLDK
jgi:hypothetical protein